MNRRKLKKKPLWHFEHILTSNDLSFLDNFTTKFMCTTWNIFYNLCEFGANPSIGFGGVRIMIDRHTHKQTGLRYYNIDYASFQCKIFNDVCKCLRICITFTIPTPNSSLVTFQVPEYVIGNRFHMNEINMSLSSPCYISWRISKSVSRSLRLCSFENRHSSEKNTKYDFLPHFQNSLRIIVSKKKWFQK